MFRDPDELSVCALLSNSNIAMADPALVLLETIFVSGTKIDKLTGYVVSTMQVTEYFLHVYTEYH